MCTSLFNTFIFHSVFEKPIWAYAAQPVNLHVTSLSCKTKAIVESKLIKNNFGKIWDEDCFRFALLSSRPFFPPPWDNKKPFRLASLSLICTYSISGTAFSRLFFFCLSSTWRNNSANVCKTMWWAPEPSFRKVVFLSHCDVDANQANQDGALCPLTCRLHMQSSGRLCSFSGPVQLRSSADCGDKNQNENSWRLKRDFAPKIEYSLRSTSAPDIRTDSCWRWRAWYRALCVTSARYWWEVILKRDPRGSHNLLAHNSENDWQRHVPRR